MPFLALSDIDARNPAPGFHGKFIHTDRLTVAHFEIEAGATLPTHAHPHEQITNVIDGQFEFTLDGETRVLGPGSVVTIPGNVPHSGRAITACRLVDVFHPAREDYR